MKTRALRSAKIGGLFVVGVVIVTLGLRVIEAFSSSDDAAGTELNPLRPTGAEIALLPVAYLVLGLVATAIAFVVLSLQARRKA